MLNKPYFTTRALRKSGKDIYEYPVLNMLSNRNQLNNRYKLMQNPTEIVNDRTFPYLHFFVLDDDLSNNAARRKKIE